MNTTYNLIIYIILKTDWVRFIVPYPLSQVPDFKNIYFSQTCLKSFIKACFPLKMFSDRINDILDFVNWVSERRLFPRKVNLLCCTYCCLDIFQLKVFVKKVCCYCAATVTGSSVPVSVSVLMTGSSLLFRKCSPDSLSFCLLQFHPCTRPLSFLIVSKFSRPASIFVHLSFQSVSLASSLGGTPSVSQAKNIFPLLTS